MTESPKKLQASMRTMYMPSGGRISQYGDYSLNEKDEEIFIFLKDKYLYQNPQLNNIKCPWEDRNQRDFRKQFADFIKELADSKTKFPQVNQLNLSSQANYLSAMIGMVDNCLALLCENKFQEAEALIKKSDFNKLPQFQKRLNAFSLKMLKYESILQENNRKKQAQIQLDFYHKIVQNMNEPKSLQSFIALHKKSPYMDPNLNNKLQKNVVLSFEKEQFQKICKQYERAIDQMNDQLKKPIIQFKYTNMQLSSFSTKDFKSKFTEESGIKLKKYMAELICNISSSKDKKILTEVQKTQSVKANHQLWTYNLLDHFFKIVSNNFQPFHINALQAYVKAKMGSSKQIMDIIQNLNHAVSSFQQMREFEKSLDGLSIKIPSSIENILSKIKPKTYNYQNMISLFKREIVYRLMSQIHSDQTVSGNQTFIESIIARYKEWIDPDVMKSLERLALRTGKQRGILEFFKSKLSQVLALTGNQSAANLNINPNTIDFYLELQSVTQKIWYDLQKNNNSKDKNQLMKLLIPEKPDQTNNTSEESLKTCRKTQNNSDLAMMEYQLQYELTQCHELKNKLLKVFGNFDKEIYKTMIMAYSVRGGCEISRESFENYVKKKADQINKIVKEFEGPKMQIKKIISSNDNKIKEPIEIKNIKVQIGKQQMGIQQLKQQYESLNEDLAHAVESSRKMQNQYKRIIDDLKKQLEQSGSFSNLRQSRQTPYRLKTELGQHSIQYGSSKIKNSREEANLENSMFRKTSQLQPYQPTIYYQQTPQTPNNSSFTINYKLEIQSYKKQILKLSRQIKHSPEQIYELNKMINSLKLQLNKQHKQKSELTSELNAYKQNYGKITLQNPSISNSLKQTESKLLQMAQQHQKITQTYAKQISELKNKIQELMNNQTLNKSEIAQMQMKKAIQQQKYVQERDLAKKQLEFILGQGEETKNQLEQTKKQLESTKKQFEEKKIQLESNQNQLKSAMNQLESSKKQMLLLTQSLENKIQQLSEKTKRNTQLCNRQKQQIDSLLKQKRLITDELIDSQKLSRSLRYINVENILELQIKNQSNSELQQTILQLQTQIKDLKAEIQTLSSDFLKLKQENQKKKTPVFKSLKEQDESPKRNKRLRTNTLQSPGSQTKIPLKPSIHHPQQQNINDEPSAHNQQQKTINEHQQKIKQNSQQIQKKFQKNLDKQLPKKITESINVKSTTEQNLTQNSKDFMALKSQIEELTLQNQKSTRIKQAQTKRADHLSSQMTKLQKQINFLKAAAEQQKLQLKEFVFLEEKKKQIKEREVLQNKNISESIKKQADQLKQKIADLQIIIDTQKSQRSSLQKVVEQHKQQKIVLTKEKESNELLIRDLQQKVEYLKQTNQKLRQTIVQLEDYTKKIKPAQNQPVQKKPTEQSVNELLSKQLEQFRVQFNELKEQKERLKILNQQSQKVRKGYQEEIKKAKLQYAKQIEQVWKQNSKLQRQIKDLQCQIKDLQCQIKMLNVYKNLGISPVETSQASQSELKIENEKLKKSIQQLHDQINTRNSSIKELTNINCQLQNQLKSKQEKSQRLQILLATANENIDKLNEKLQQSIQNHNQANEAIYQLKKQLEETLQNANNHTRKFLSQQIFQNQEDKRALLVNAIQQKVNSKIKSTKLIYSYDPLNKTSFHQYIDGKKNLLIVFLTEHDKILGAFSTSSIQRNHQEPQNTISFLFTFNSNLKEPISCFDLKKQNKKARSLVWDEKFLIVGNTDISWHQGQNIIKSDFGRQHGHYDPNGRKIADFLQAEDERMIQSKGFECFQIQFDE